MSKMKEINKIIITKVKEADADEEIKSFLIDVINFERDYFNEDLNRFSAQYKKYAEFHIRKMIGDKK